MTQAPENMQIFRPYLSEMMAPTGAVTIEPLWSHSISLSPFLCVYIYVCGIRKVRFADYLHIIERGNTRNPDTIKFSMKGLLEVGHGSDGSNEWPLELLVDIRFFAVWYFTIVSIGTGTSEGNQNGD